MLSGNKARKYVNVTDGKFTIIFSRDIKRVICIQ